MINTSLLTKEHAMNVCVWCDELIVEAPVWVGGCPMHESCECEFRAESLSVYENNLEAANKELSEIAA